MSNSENTIELRSEEVQEILTAVPNWMIRWGNSLVFALIIGLLFISWFVKYPDIISSEALVTTQLAPHKEYSNINGKMDTILIENNQMVLANTPLGIIENSANYEDVFYLKSIIDTIRVNKQYFNFPSNEIPLLFLGEIDSYFAIFENNYTEYKLNLKFQPYSNEAIANNFTLSELKTRLTTLHSQKSLNESELSFQKSDLKRHKKLYNEGVISLQDYELKQRTYLQSERNFSSVDATISQIRETISNTQKISKGVAINSAKEKIKLLRNVIQSFNQLKIALKDWEKKYLFSSNINGTVSFLNVWNENQIINQGDLVFTIIPENNIKYISKLKTPARNSGKIKMGQTVIVKLENYPEEEFGTLKGRVESISNMPDNEGFYHIDASLPTKLITSYGSEIIFKQEMGGTAKIISEDLRLIERFFYRLRGIFK